MIHQKLRHLPVSRTQLQTGRPAKMMPHGLIAKTDETFIEVELAGHIPVGALFESLTFLGVHAECSAR